jgi:hypothetical protein
VLTLQGLPFSGSVGEKYATAWLINLRSILNRHQAEKALGEGAPGGRELLAPALCMLLGALTLHESPLVRRQAVLAVAAVPACYPLMGILLVPLLVFLLQSSTATGG